MCFLPLGGTMKRQPIVRSCLWIFPFEALTLDARVYYKDGPPRESRSSKQLLIGESRQDPRSGAFSATPMREQVAAMTQRKWLSGRAFLTKLWSSPVWVIRSAH